MWGGRIVSESTLTSHINAVRKAIGDNGEDQRGVPVTVNYRSVPTLTYYREKYGYKPDSFPVSYEWGEGPISLPLYPDLPKEAQDHVIKAVLEAVVPLCRKAGRN